MQNFAQWLEKWGVDRQSEMILKWREIIRKWRHIKGAHLIVLIVLEGGRCKHSALSVLCCTH